MSEAGECMGVVLVVDDDPVARRLIRATLAPVGFEVIEAGDGEQALAVLRDRLPDVRDLRGHVEVTQPGYRSSSPPSPSESSQTTWQPLVPRSIRRFARRVNG